MILQRHKWSELGPSKRQGVLARPLQDLRPKVREQVEHIVKDVRQQGDDAIRRYTSTFDKVTLDALKVSDDEFTAAHRALGKNDTAALQAAIDNIEAFHRATQPETCRVKVAPGVSCRREFRPIQSVGLYVPGGTAPLPSTVMMLSVPARLAGCPKRVLATPPGSNGSVDAFILVAATMCGITDVFKMGGALAIAAMAFGTQSVPKVDKVFGPGNPWVTEAKSQCAQSAAGAAYDLPAGPSEVLVIADDWANASFVAADLLSQAEHGVDSQVLLVTDSERLADRVEDQLLQQLDALPRRGIAKQSLARSACIHVTDTCEAMAVSNQYAPEHLILQTENAEQLASLVVAAGSVFVGPWSPEAVGDYASGTNHVLPTYGHARAYSGLAVEDFMTRITFQCLTRAGLETLAPTVQRLARAEGLFAHENAVTLRVEAT